jgi:hypothetical protein
LRLSFESQPLSPHFTYLLHAISATEEALSGRTSYAISLKAVIGLLAAALFGAGCGGCDSPNPVTQDPLVGLSIFLYQHAEEARPNENVYIGCTLHDAQGQDVRGQMIYLSVTPDSVGDITRWSPTNPDSATGFDTRVTFIGRRPGVALITGQARDNAGAVIGQDTTHILVRDPING